LKTQTPEEFERRRRLARLRIARLREYRERLEQRDLEKDPEYLPESPEEVEEASAEET